MMRERRAALDFADVVRWLVEDVYPEADKVVLVFDNLNTHKAASLYEAFPPEQARDILTLEVADRDEVLPGRLLRRQQVVAHDLELSHRAHPPRVTA